MTEGSIVLASMAQADGNIKPRPAVVLRHWHRRGDLLLCGISTQLSQEVSGFDETITSADADFAVSGLKSDSLIRLGFLANLPRSAVKGEIGAVSTVRHARLLTKLSGYLTAALVKDEGANHDGASALDPDLTDIDAGS
jgi:mRNA interferase MazF